MKSNVEQLARLQAGLEQARDDLEGINEEERLLEWEQSMFPQLQTMFQLKEPYDKLWNTAWSFNQKHEAWMNGIVVVGKMIIFEPPRGKTNNVVSEQVRHKPTCTSTEKS